MPKGMGYGKSYRGMKGAKCGPYGGKGGMSGGAGYKAGPYSKGSMDTAVSNPTSYRYSKAKPVAGANSAGFSRNPKQDSPGRMTSDPFPRPRGWTGG